MHLGLYTDSVPAMSLPEALDLAVRIGATAIEISTGGQSSAPHLSLDRLLSSEDDRTRLTDALERRGLHLSALNCSAWLLHPRLGTEHASVVQRTIRLAEMLGVSTIVTMAGCPGDHPDALVVNWPWYPWPAELAQLRERQWDAVTDLWRELGPFALDHGVTSVALELHPLQLVYNVPTLLELRAAIGPVIGANLDPSHLFWQHMDPIAVARALGPVVRHVHLKDTAIVADQVALAGVLDHRSFDTPAERAWNFRTLGQGHDEAFWRRFLAALGESGYDGALSIENEDRSLDPVDSVIASASFVMPLIADRNAAGAGAASDVGRSPVMP
ncbi:MAG: sugar phosphate isomerase/epimerase [Chloroflexi bacterium]|nr:sugar phosphate isomerase/epimerase [Chloroflexota bacterium]